MSYDCSGCGSRFRSLRGFDAHLEHDHTGAGVCRCRSAAELRLAGYVLDPRGIWVDPRTTQVQVASRRGGARRKARSACADSSQSRVRGRGKAITLPGPSRAIFGPIPPVPEDAA